MEENIEATKDGNTASVPAVVCETSGCVRMPIKLTAENGAKEALMGEFSVALPVVCPICGGDADEYCSGCENSGEVTWNINVPWTVIKDIYAKAVNLLAQENAPSSCTVESIVRNVWNHIADGRNQWGALGQDEKDELMNAAVAEDAQ